MPYVAMLASFLVLVYLETNAPASPANSMTVVIFVLTLLVMLRQGVLSRDDALLRERRAVGHRRGPLRVADQERLRRDHDRRRRRTTALRLAGRRAHLRDPARRPRRPQPARSLERGRPRAAGRVSRRGRRDAAAARSARSKSWSTPSERRSTLECVGSNLLDDPAIAGLALNFRDVSERKALEEQLRQLAFHDPLTLLANRSLFRNRVEHALALAHRSRQLVAVMFLDLDNFKNVNDSLGPRRRRPPAAGGGAAPGQVDAAVRHRRAARRRRVRDPARGHHHGRRRRAHRRGDHRSPSTRRCCSTAAKPTMSASIGVAFSQPGDDTEQLLRNADIAMYNAKAAGKGRFVVFHPRMQEQLRRSAAARGGHATARWSATSSSSSTSRSSTSPTASCSASRRWCAGITRSTAA